MIVMGIVRPKTGRFWLLSPTAVYVKLDERELSFYVNQDQKACNSYPFAHRTFSNLVSIDGVNELFGSFAL